MKKKAVVKFFGSKAETARRLGVTKQAISQWGDVVPAESAIILERITEGKLKVIPSLYKKQNGGESDRTSMG